MTGYTVHTGSSEKFAAGWDRIFKSEESDENSDSAETPAKTKKNASRKKAAKKKTATKAAAKKAKQKKAGKAKGR